MNVRLYIIVGTRGKITFTAATLVGSFIREANVVQRDLLCVVVIMGHDRSRKDGARYSREQKFHGEQERETGGFRRPSPKDGSVKRRLARRNNK